MSHGEPLPDGSETGSFTLIVAGIIILLMMARVSEWWAELRRYFGFNELTAEVEDEEHGG